MQSKITELLHDDLVCILSFVHDFGYFGLSYDREEWKELSDDLKTDDPCFEDKLADMLLAGRAITVIDFDAAGELYSPYGLLDEDGNGIYGVTMEDFFEWGDAPLAYEIIEGDGDAYTAHEFIQKVLFRGEVIYG